MSGRFSIDAIFTAHDRMTRPMARIESRSMKMARAMSGSLKSVERAFGGVHNAIKATTVALAGAGAAAAFIGRNLVTAGADFEQAITNVAAVSLVTRDQIKDLEAEAKRLGRTTKFTAAEVANAMELMGKAGFSNAAIMKGVGGVLAAAAADGIEIAEAAGIVSNAIKGMGLDVEKDAGRVADVLALASARTNSSMASLGESLSNVAATASDFKIPFEQTVAAVALLQDVGLDASVAGSALNTMLVQLAKPTDAVRAKMASLGVKFQDAKGNMLPLRDVMGGIAKAMTKSGGNMKQVALIADLVGLRGQKAASQLAKLAKAGKFDELMRELDNAAGSAEKMAAIRMDTLLGDWEQFTGAVDGVKLALFDLQGGALRQTVQGWTQWVEANQDLIVSKVGEWLRDFQKALPGLIKDAKALGGEVVFVARAIYKTVRALDAFMPRLKTIGTGLIVFYSVAAAVKVARVAVSGYTLAAKAAAWASGLFATRTAAAGSAAALAETASKSYAAALEAWSVSSTSATAAAGGFRAMLNNTATKVLPMLGTQLTALTGTQLLGSAGLVAAAGAVGYAIGTWLDKATGFSDWVASFASNKTLDEIGRTNVRGSGPPAPQASTAGGAAGTSGTDPQMVEPAERQRVLLEEHASRIEKVSREKVDVTIHDKSGRAELQRKHPRARSGAGIKLRPSGAF